MVNFTRKHWPAIRAELHKNWEGISLDELDSHWDNPLAIATLINQRYGIAKTDILRKIHDLASKAVLEAKASEAA